MFDSLLKFETLGLDFILFIEIVFFTPVLSKNTMLFRGLFLYLPHHLIYWYGEFTVKANNSGSEDLALICPGAVLLKAIQVKSV
jgi:hypothetical protein